MCRERDALRSQAGPAVITITSAGTSVSSVRTLEKSRVRQTSQYGSPCSVATAAASANEDRRAPGAPPTTMNTHHPAQRVKADGRIAQPAHTDGGEEGFATIGDEEHQHQGQGPHHPQLRDQVGRESGKQVDPPPPRWCEQKGGGQDRVGRPHDRRCRGRKPEDEADVRPDVIAHADEERNGHGAEAACTPRARCFPGHSRYSRRMVSA